MGEQPSFLLRALEPSDFEDWWEIRNCPNVMRATLSLPFSSKAAAQERLVKPASDRFTVVAEVDGKVVGLCNLGVGRGRMAHTGHIGVMVHDDYASRGLGTAMLRATIDLAERWLGLERLELDVYTDNATAIHLYKKFDFVIEGTKRAFALRDGEYADAYVMARLKREAKSLLS